MLLKIALPVLYLIDCLKLNPSIAVNPEASIVVSDFILLRPNCPLFLACPIRGSIRELKDGVKEYIEFSNQRRFHQYLKYKKPIEIYNFGVDKQFKLAA